MKDTCRREAKIRKKLNLKNAIRFSLFISGLFVLALGAVAIIKANLGAATWDVLHVGLSRITGLSIGRWVQIVGATLLAITALFEKERPPVGSLLNMFIVGFFVDLILDSGLIPSFKTLGPRSLMLIAGITLMGAGSGMYVSAEIGAGPRDGATLLMAKRLSISVRLSRALLELAAMTLGWLIGGPVSLGTFLSIPLTGPAMQLSLKFFTRQLDKI